MHEAQWDRYVAGQWWTQYEWLRTHPDDPRAPGLRAMYESSQRAYLSYERRYFGWGVFVLRAKA